VDRYPFDAEYLRRLSDGDPSTVEQYRQSEKRNQLDASCSKIPNPESSVHEVLRSERAKKRVQQTLKLLRPKEAEILRGMFNDDMPKN